MLVHPSLASPTGIAWSMWSWIKPEIYDHFEWSAIECEDSKAATRHRAFIVVLLLNEDHSGANFLSLNSTAC